MNENLGGFGTRFAVYVVEIVRFQVDDQVD